MKGISYALLLVVGLGLAGCSGSGQPSAVIETAEDKTADKAVDETFVAPEAEPKKEEANNDELIPPTQETPPAGGSEKPSETPPAIYTFIPMTLDPGVLKIVLPTASVSNVNVHWEEATGSILLGYDAVVPAGAGTHVLSEPGKEANCKEAKPAEKLDAFASRFSLRCEPKKKNRYDIEVVDGAGAVAASSKVTLNFGTPKVELLKIPVAEPIASFQMKAALPWTLTTPFELTIDGGVMKGSFTSRRAARAVRLQHFDPLFHDFVTDWSVSSYLKDTVEVALNPKNYLVQLSVLELEGGEWRSATVAYKFKTQFEAKMTACDASYISIKTMAIRAFAIDCGDADYDLVQNTGNGLISIPTRDSADWSVSNGLLDRETNYHGVDLKSAVACSIHYVAYDGTPGDATPVCN